MDRKEARERAKALVARMTVEEKISQLRYNSPSIDRLRVPAYNWWGEALHGVARAGTATSFPQAIGMAAAFDTDLMEQIGGAIADEGRAKYNAYSEYNDRDIYKGLTFWSPNINIFRDPRWGRGQETYGEDPYLTGTLGTSFVEGIQGDGEYLKAAACAKHFAVHSGPEALRDSFNAIVSEKDLWETYLPAFEALVEDGHVESVMTSDNGVNGEPAGENRYLIEDVLRGEWGFGGYCVSDCRAARDFHEGHRGTEDAAGSAARAINAGTDLNCGDSFLYLYDAYKQGLVSEARITQAAEQLFTTRYMLGLFDGCEYDDIPYTVVECPEHLELSERAARESFVLLKNNGLLPLNRRRLKTIGVIGPNANSREALVGNDHGTATEYITPLDGILRYVGNDVRVLYSEGCDVSEDRIEKLAYENDRLSEAMIVADNSDVVILCLGLNEKLEGEEGDAVLSQTRGDKVDLLLPASQRELMHAIADTGKPTVLCLMAGGPIDLSFADKHFDAILNLWYPGARGGRVLAQMLFGDVSPSGKLDVTFYHNDDPLPDFGDYSMKGRTYRYLEAPPLYPFGYGLTYGDIRVLSAEMFDGSEDRKDKSGQEDAQEDRTDSASPDSGEGTSPDSEEDLPLTVVVRCQNKGRRRTQDVIQVYVEITDEPDAPLNPRLCGFARVELRPREKKDVVVTLDPDTFTVVNEKGERVKTETEAILYIGTGQPDPRTKELTGMEPVTIRI